jgi:hypothetical protein
MRWRRPLLRYASACERILVQGERVRGVRLAGGEEIAADAVVFNGDKHALAAGLLGPGVQAAVAPTPREQRSLSAVTWAVHAQTDGFALARHNVFFDDDYASEFDDIFTRRRLPRQGTVYVCAQDRGSDGAAAAARRGRERLLCLVNAPPDGDRHPFDATETDPCEHRSRPARCCARRRRTLPACFRPRVGRCTARRRTAGCRPSDGRARARRCRACTWRAAACTRARACRWRP